MEAPSELALNHAEALLTDPGPSSMAQYRPQADAPFPVHPRYARMLPPRRQAASITRVLLRLTQGRDLLVYKPDREASSPR